MAAGGSNWKRPWQDDGGSQYHRSPFSGPVQSASENAHPLLPRDAAEGISRKEQSMAQGSRSSSSTREEHPSLARQSVYHELANGSRDHAPSMHSSPTLSSKRVRLDAAPAEQRRFEPSDAGAMSQYPPRHPGSQTGYLEPRSTNGRPPQPSSARRDGFMSLVGPPPYEPIPSAAQRPRDMSSLIDNRSLIREDTNRNCSVCEKANALAPKIAKGLQRLHKQLKHILEKGKNDAAPEATASTETTIQEPPERLVEALDFSIDRLNENMKIAKEMLYNLSLDDRSSNDGFGHSQLGDASRTRRDQGDRTSGNSMAASSAAGGENPRQPEYSTVGRGEKTDGRDSIYQPSPYGSGQGRPNSPNRKLPSLPSPPNITFQTSAGILPPMSPSVVGANGQSPHITHLQDLQHQLSTKSLAHQILQGEHEKLLAAYSRSQRKCADLDKKSQVSDAEISNLSEERMRLQAFIESLEQQVEELQQSRDEAHKQSVANGSQYMQIMAMSSKLQAQGSVDQKKWKSDRDEWTAEKDRLLARIANLEKSAGQILKHDHDGEHGLQTQDSRNRSEEAELSGLSFERLKEEIISLRRGKRESDTLLQAYKDETGALRKLTEELSAVGERLTKMGASAPLEAT